MFRRNEADNATHLSGRDLAKAHLESGGPHEPKNGILLPSDLHTLIDQGIRDC
jgi:HNH endonuclease